MDFHFDPLSYPHPSRRSVVYGRKGMVATGNPLAAQAGLEILKKGGNAIDAMIQMYGIYEFQKMIEDRQTMPNPKYAMLIKQHHLDVLANHVERYFYSK